jgi:hypothetical protein
MPEIDAQVVHDPNGITTSGHVETPNRNDPETFAPGPKIWTPGATPP